MYPSRPKAWIAAMLKYLRIAVTALSLTACMLLVALWMQSYTWTDLVFGSKANSPIEVAAWSQQGQLGFTSTTYVSEIPHINEFGVRSETDFILPRGKFLGFGYYYQKTHVFLMAPYWFAILTTIGLAAAPWIKWRFSLRTLLIATTLVAVGLGIIVAAR
jgi:hypothetical protein